MRTWLKTSAANGNPGLRAGARAAMEWTLLSVTCGMGWVYSGQQQPSV
jgi:hypothetical protein